MNFHDDMFYSQEPRAYSLDLRDLRALRGCWPFVRFVSFVDQNPRTQFDKADGHCYNFQCTSADVAQLAEQLFRK